MIKVKDIMQTVSIRQTVEIRNADSNLLWRADSMGTWPQYSNRAVDMIYTADGALVLVLKR